MSDKYFPDKRRDQSFPNRRRNDEDAMKRVMKEAIKEWLNERYIDVGKWTLRGILAAILVLIAYGIVASNIVPWGK